MVFFLDININGQVYLGLFASGLVLYTYFFAVVPPAELVVEEDASDDFDDDFDDNANDARQLRATI